MEDDVTMKVSEPAALLIKLTQEMKDAALKAERDFENGKCFSEADFKERFAKWL